MKPAVPGTSPTLTYGVRRVVRSVGAALALAATTLLAGCAPSAAPTGPGPTEPAPRLPPIPAADGPLDLRVSYPRDSMAIATRASTFIFGSAGSGRARVWIQGREVEVRPNGGFLAFLPVPRDAVWRLRATLDGETRTLDVPISLPPAPPDPGDSVAIVPGSVHPVGAWVALPGERIPVGFVGTAGGEAWLELGDDRVPLVPVRETRGGATDFEAAPDGSGDGAAAGDAQATGSGSWQRYTGFFAARRVVTPDTAVGWPSLTGEPRPTRPDTSPGREAAGGEEAAADSVAGRPGPARARLYLAVGPDTAVERLPLNVLMVDPDRPATGIGRDLDPPARNGDGRVVARPGPGGGPYHYVWANGVELELTGERNGAYRVRLTDALSAWTPAGDIQLRVPGTPPPASRVDVVRLDPRPGYVDVRIALDRRLPYAVEEGDGRLAVVVYGATSRANFLQHGRVDPYVQRAEWSQPADRVFRVDLRLDGPVWGYETYWGAGDDLVLRVRRPPAIDRGNPFRGLTVGVDPGHGGTDTLTMGPTGLTEADANLAIALALRDELERRGAVVVMTRTSNVTRSLVERTRLAREQDVDVWVSVHNNAFPDGVDPWENNGTSVYYNHPRSAALARSVHRALLDELGLRDLGVGRADFHQARFAWAPAILTENLFMMIPEHEAFLKTAAGARRVARAHVRGLEAWLTAGARDRDRDEE